MQKLIDFCICQQGVAKSAQLHLDARFNSNSSQKQLMLNTFYRSSAGMGGLAASSSSHFNRTSQGFRSSLSAVGGFGEGVGAFGGGGQRSRGQVDQNSQNFGQKIEVGSEQDGAAQEER